MRPSSVPTRITHGERLITDRGVSPEMVVDATAPAVVASLVVIGTHGSGRWSSQTDRSRRLRVMVAGEAKALTAVALGHVSVLFERRLGSVMIAGVAGRATVFEWLAPVTGLTTSEQVRAGSVADAAAHARTGVSFISKDTPVQHRVADCWPTALQMAWEYDVLVLADWPRNWLDRRAVAAFATRAGAPVTIPTTTMSVTSTRGAQAGVARRSH